MKLNPKNYSIKQAESDFKTINFYIIKTLETSMAIKKTLTTQQNYLNKLYDRKLVRKIILREKLQQMTNVKSRRRIERLLKS